MTRPRADIRRVEDTHKSDFPYDGIRFLRHPLCAVPVTLGHDPTTC